MLLDPTAFTYSIVIPVYNSEPLVGETVDRVVEVFSASGLKYELILVNDGSHDGSWNVIADRARAHPQVTAINLLKNYGQHHANLAGFQESTGDYVITMDDDLQNPPEEALKLIDKAMHGHDVVFGKFERKQSAGYRRIGTRLIAMINRRIFLQPPDLVVSNHRILRRDVVDRICAARNAHPYITGQALMYSSCPANTAVRHEPRPAGAEQLQPSADPVAGAHHPFQLLLLAAAGHRARRLRRGRAQLPAGRLLPAQRPLARDPSRGLDHAGRPRRRHRRHHHRHAVHDRRVRRPHSRRGEHEGELPRLREGHRMRRHFLVIGAQRCGTTYLHELLADHPEIAMARPFRPEPKVFLADEVVERGVEWYERTWFPHAGTAGLLGEKSTSYLESPEAVTRVVAVLDRPQIVVQLRDPVERAVSNWSFSRSHGMEDRSVTEALTRNLDGPLPWDRQATSVSPHAYLERGRYAEYLTPWLDAFPGLVRVQFLEDLVGSPDRVGELYEWLGVDAGVRPDSLGHRVNQAEPPEDSLDAGLVDRLRDYFNDSDRALAGLLGRELPWHNPVGGAR